jgi:organic radical activating enzyme
MVNTQPVESLDLRQDGSLDVHSIFPTIQGEGPFVGTPAVFVRLAGCNLRCGGNGVACDTDYTSTRRRYEVFDLVKRINDTWPNISLVVITGGEPFRQNIAPFISKFPPQTQVQVETNGTLFNDALNDSLSARWNLTIVCSPKTPKIHPMMQDWLFWHGESGCYKYVLEASAVDPDDGLPTSVLGMSVKPARPNPLYPKGRIFVQPVDLQDPQINKANQQAAVVSCLAYGYRLSLQTHKILGLE